MFAKEDVLLSDLINLIVGRIPDARVSALMFDGFIIALPRGSAANAADVLGCLDAFSDERRLLAVVKPWTLLAAGPA